MTDLETFFNSDGHNLINKWKHYFSVYERHLNRFRNQDIVLVEFGVAQGGSIQMWKHYFGEGLRYYGLDINPSCKQFESENVTIFIGDQEDRDFLRSSISKIPSIDILMEDGGHTMKQQIHTFEETFSHIKPQGIYLVEDLHTSYWKDWGGGVGRPGTFIEYSKNLIDSINAWHSHEPEKLAVNDLTNSINSLHFYDSMLVIEKGTVIPPTSKEVGGRLFPDFLTVAVGPDVSAANTNNMVAPSLIRRLGQAIKQITR